MNAIHSMTMRCLYSTCAMSHTSTHAAHASTHAMAQFTASTHAMAHSELETKSKLRIFSSHN